MKTAIEHIEEAYKRERSSWAEQTRVRFHRALKWAKRAEEDAGDADAEFIFLWISFNAAYARVIEERNSTNERGRYEDFLRLLVVADRKKKLSTLLFSSFADSLTRLIANQYVLWEFWQQQLYPENQCDWELELSKSIRRSEKAVREQDIHTYLMIVLSRVHVLRNQIMHGAATYGGGTNREQVQDATHFMRQFVPTMLDIMLSDPDQDWGDVMYPVR
jgi:hypothetical protein